MARPLWANRRHPARTGIRTVEATEFLSIGPDGSHQLTCTDRVGVIMPSGFESITVFPKFGKPIFEGHPVPGQSEAECTPLCVA